MILKPNKKKQLKQMKMSTHEDDDLEHDQEEINVDDVDSDSRISYGSNASDIDLDGNGSCYDDSETAIRLSQACQTLSSNERIVKVYDRRENNLLSGCTFV